MGPFWLALAIGVGVGVRPTEFLIDTDTPDALCPELAMTRAAVRNRLGTLEVEGGGVWRGLYNTVHDPSGRRGDYVRLVILDPSGKEQTSRELPIQGASCVTLAQAIALVVDGFFRELSRIETDEVSSNDEPGTAQVPDVPVSEAPTPTQTPRAPAGGEDAAFVRRSEADVSQKSASIHPGGRFLLSLGSGYESMSKSAAAYFGLLAALGHSWRVSLRGGLPAQSFTQPYREGDAHLYAIPLRFSLHYHSEIVSGLRLYLGPEVLVSFERASTANLAGGHQGWRASLGAGGHVALGYELTPRLTFATGFSGAAIAVDGRRFMLDSNQEFAPPSTRLAGMLELWGTIFQ